MDTIDRFEVFYIYDSAGPLWAIAAMDVDGNQIGEAEFAAKKSHATWIAQQNRRISAPGVAIRVFTRAGAHHFDISA